MWVVALGPAISLCARYPRLSSDGLRRWCASSTGITSRRAGLLRTSTETGRGSARPESQRPAIVPSERPTADDGWIAANPSRLVVAAGG
jgi:hypothetical protein